MAGLGLYFVVGSSGESESQALDSEPPALNDTNRAPTSASTTPAEAQTPPLYYSGTGTWTYADPSAGAATVFGESGTLLKYNVAVEGGLELDVQEFSDFVAATLTDRRSWIAGGGWRFQQVGESGADFTIYLASPEQRSNLCSHPDTTVSCRNGDRVVINSARWLTGVEHWDDTLDAYREYVINHEVGHRLGHPHEVCPDEGGRSPVMAQQTFQLAGCAGNAWPYPDGETYLEGPAGSYDGPALPPDDYDDE